MYLLTLSFEIHLRYHHDIKVILIIIGHGGSVDYFSYAAVKFEDVISHQKVQSKFVSRFYLSQTYFCQICA